MITFDHERGGRHWSRDHCLHFTGVENAVSTLEFPGFTVCYSTVVATLLDVCKERHQLRVMSSPDLRNCKASLLNGTCNRRCGKSTCQSRFPVSRNNSVLEPTHQTCAEKLSDRCRDRENPRNPRKCRVIGSVTYNSRVLGSDNLDYRASGWRNFKKPKNIKSNN